MLVWNAIVADKLLKQPDCISVSDKDQTQISYQFRKPSSIPSSTLPQFGIFG